MSAPGLFHWSKDFVEHLRAVHFALALVSIILIIADSSGLDGRLSKALTQVQQIAQFEKQWPTVPQRIYKQAMLDDKLPERWLDPVAIVMHRKDYPKEIDIYIRTPESEILQPDNWKTGDAFSTKPSSLVDFKDFWNRLNKGVVLLLPERPTSDSRCILDSRFTKTDGSFDFHLLGDDFFRYKSTCTYGSPLASVFAKGGPSFKYESTLLSPLYPLSPDAILKIVLDLPLSDAQKRQFKSIQTFLQIPVRLRPCRITERYLTKLFFNDWKEGDFASAFPELNSSSSGIATLEIADAVHRVESDATSSQRDVSILGFSVPLSQLSKWGGVILLSVQLYFWLHLHELASRIEPGAEGWDVAWIGLYTTRVSFAVALLSCSLLPLVAAITLAIKIVVLHVYYQKTANVLSVIVVALSALLSFLAARKLYQLRQSARLASVTQPDTDSV